MLSWTHDFYVDLVTGFSMLTWSQVFDADLVTGFLC